MIAGISAHMPIVCDDETIAAAGEGLCETGGSRLGDPAYLKQQNIDAFYRYWSSRPPRRTPACAGGREYAPDVKIRAMLDLSAQLDPAGDGSLGCGICADALRTGACLILSRELREGRWLQVNREGEIAFVSRSGDVSEKGVSKIARDRPVDIPSEILIWMYRLNR